MDYMRDKDNLAAEISYNYEKFGTTNYAFMDDTLNESVEKLEYINSAIKKSGVKITFSCYMRIDLVASFPEMVDLMLDMGLVGGFLGIESMDETARKKIGKRLTNEKILRTIDAFRAKTDTLWFDAGLIIGLPGQTMASIHQTQEWLVEQNGRYFNHWMWYPLYIARYHRWLTSEFDRNYTKHGFRFVNEDDIFDSRWISDITSFDEAKQIADDLNAASFSKKQISCWGIGHLYSHGFSFEQMSGKTQSEIDFGQAIKNKERIVNQYKVAMRKKARLISST